MGDITAAMYRCWGLMYVLGSGVGVYAPHHVDSSSSCSTADLSSMPLCLG